MDHDLICSWLGLPPGEWPPDHYRLLGLEAGESNAELIEQRVHERLDTVRRYQMMHPEQATEAMNRLAQAFVCLTEPSAKKTYDAQLGVVAAVAPAPILPPPQAEPLDWLPSQPPFFLPSEPVPLAVPAITSPPPLPVMVPNYAPAPPPLLRQPPPLPPLPPLPPVVEEAELSPPAAIPIAPLAVPALPLEPNDPIQEAAQSAAARRGIATRRSLYQRIARTRRLLRLWNELGKYLSVPKRRLSRSADGPELLRLLDEITALLKSFPPLLGEAGQPGYLVLALTQVDTVKVFQSFSPHQREALSRDWHAAVKLLTSHRHFLRQELRAMRQRSFGQRLLRATWTLIVEQPGTVLLLLALLAINVALWRTYAEVWWEKLFSR
jgi:hypothetical protein